MAPGRVYRECVLGIAKKGFWGLCEFRPGRQESSYRDVAFARWRFANLWILSHYIILSERLEGEFGFNVLR